MEEDIKPDWKIMMDEIVIPSIVADQPNNEEWDENTVVSWITVFMLIEVLQANSYAYSFRNPNNQLPIHEMFDAIK